MGIIARLKQQMAQTKSQIGGGVKNFFRGRLDEEFFKDLEFQLLKADVGVEETTYLIQRIKKLSRESEVYDLHGIKLLLSGEISGILAECEHSLDLASHDKTFVVLSLGVNGGGKTTTIVKMADSFKKSGKSVLLVAGDTFRSAAKEQLRIWGKRVGVPVFLHKNGRDSASVVFDACQSARSKSTDIVLVDTAGRLHTDKGLLEELKKVKRVIAKASGYDPQEVLLILDGTNGRNMLSQFRVFNEALGVTGLVVTKLDGTSKGGAVLSIARQCKCPIRYIGVGEAQTDLLPFDAKQYADSIVFD